MECISDRHRTGSRFVRSVLLLGIVVGIAGATLVLAGEVLFSGQQNISTGAGGIRILDVADVNDDGSLDIVGASRTAGKISWWERSGSGWTENVITTTWVAAIARFVDVDGDGNLDIVAGSILPDVEEPPLVWWQNQGGAASWLIQTIPVTVTEIIDFAAGDMDGDLDVDLVVATYNDHTLVWLENTTGDGSTWKYHELSSSMARAYTVFLVDMDDDDDLDVVAGDVGSGPSPAVQDVLWWENTAGNGSAWDEHLVTNEFDRVRSIYVVDLDGDDDMDILGAAREPDDIVWFENTDGAALAWEKHMIDAGFNGAHSVHAGDLDHDGDLDVLGAAYDGDTIAWWENDGSPVDGGWIQHVIEVGFNGAHCVLAVDLDRDHDLDVLAAATAGGIVAWWESSLMKHIYLPLVLR